MRYPLWVVLVGVPTLAWAQISFDSSFECGNGTGFNQVSPGLYEFEIEADTNSTDRQWYYFEVEGAAGQTLTFRLINTNTTNVPSHWATARPVFSRDEGETFSRTSGGTSTTSTTHEFTHAFQSDLERLAFHDPYPYSRVQQKVVEWVSHPQVESSVPGQSVEGRNLALLRITDPAFPDGEKVGVWIIARQHAGEVTGSWTLEGFLDYALSDSVEARALRANALINVIPFMNPDGATAGNYRDNFRGVNLNRVWDGSATMQDSPEVVHAKRVIDEWAAGSSDYSWFFDFHSTSGASPHFAFHAAASSSSPEYNAVSEQFLDLVESFAPHFDSNRGSSTSMNESLAYHGMRMTYGVQAFTPEGTYNTRNHGPEPGAPQTPQTHREVGEAFARALVSFHEFKAPGTSALDVH